ncbi:hypothetical protein BYT27DRAFT_7203449 [Phlegmacium glaucopus]|nr:hypothetical protein BYT27DRAFT_7203449 [Phlegmacium glaucopus]
MLEEANSTATHHDVVTVAEHQSTHLKIGVGSSSQAAKVYATTAEAIANFKPTHREVISGIAPHVFDERKRRRSQRRASSSSSRTYWCETGGEKRPSPLRGTTVIAWEEHSIYLNQPDPQRRSKENIETNSIGAFTSEATNVQRQGTTHNNTNGTTLEKIDSDNLKPEALWKYLRIDTHLFRLKTIAVKLKSARTR